MKSTILPVQIAKLTNYRKIFAGYLPAFCKPQNTRESGTSRLAHVGVSAFSKRTGSTTLIARIVHVWGGVRGGGVWFRMNELLNRFTGNISPVALLVSSFFWSWFDVVPLSPVLFSAAGRTLNVLPLIVSLAVSAALLAVFAASRTIRMLVLNPKAFALFSAICGSVGSALIWMGAQDSLALLVAGGVLIGMYQSIGAVLVGSVAACQGPTNALIHIAAALPLNIVAILLVMFLQPFASVVFAVMLPLFSSLSYAIYLVRGQNKKTLHSVALVKGKRVGRTRRIFGCDPYFLLMVLVISASFGFVNYQSLFLGIAQGAFLEYASIGLRAAVSLSVLVGYLLCSWRPYSILRVALLFMSLGLIASGAIAVLGTASTFVSNCLFLMGYACFDLLIWALIIMLGYQSGTSLLRLICVVYAVDQFGILAGTSLGMVTGGSASIVSSIVLGSALLLLMLGFSSGKNAVKETLDKYEIDFATADQALSEASAFASSRGHQGRITEMTAQFFLTSREAEVLSLLMEGRNGPQISEQLHVSENTVKSHIRHIYTKLNVHDRQELLDLVFPPSA
ncbi:helix-turn-helix transcriptional regulator [Gordonibacter sp.]|uniref:helix-turn-helix transcriptional regulator n=1 Tax=Gordonibacter sp. TaxID=1968902 RepID=UPI002FC764D9